MKAESIIGVIGGTALKEIGRLESATTVAVDTPYGQPSSALTQGIIGKQKFVFLSRHGERHQIPPHAINYRANIRALYEAGVSEIIAIAAVGGISDTMSPGSLVIPDQIIDYTCFETSPGLLRWWRRSGQARRFHASLRSRTTAKPA